MDRESTYHSIFHDQEDAHDFVTKTGHFGLQRAMSDANTILHELINNLTSELREAKTRNKDYLDSKLDA